MNDVVSQRKAFLPNMSPRAEAAPLAAPDVQAIARQSGFDKSGLSSGYRDAGRVVRNRAPRDAQLSLKITTETARWIREHASNTGMSIPDILEEAISAYRSRTEA